MTKKLLALLCVVALALVCFAACSNDDEPETTEPVTTAESTDPATEPVDTDEPETDVPETTEPVTTETPDTEAPDTEPDTEPEGPTQSGETTRSGRTARTTKPPATAPKVTATSAKTVPSNKRTLAKDKVQDLGGFKFTFSSSWFLGDITNKTLFAQNVQARAEQVMDDYNCQILFKNNIYAQPEAVKEYILSNRSPGSVIEGMIGTMLYPNVGQDYLISWDDIEGSPINYDDARWVDSYTELGRYPLTNKVYGIQFMRPAEVRFCVVFNKDLITKNGKSVDALYDAVKTKTWNFNMLRDYALACTKDTNSDGSNDTWGIIGNYQYMMDSFIWGNGGRIIDIVNNEVVGTPDSAKNIAGISFISQLVNEDKVVWFPQEAFSPDTWSTGSDYDPIAEFLKGNIAFLFYESWVINQQVRPGAKFDYGMLPIPMGPNATDYVTPADLARVCFCLRNNKDALKSAIVLNALARPLNDTVEYWDQVQDEYFQKNDTKSLEVYKFCLEKSWCDLGMGVPSMVSALNHAIARCVMWSDGSAAANLQALQGNYAAEIAAIYAH